MLKINDKVKKLINYIWLFELSVCLICMFYVISIVIGTGGIIHFLQVMGRDLQVIYPFSSFWLFMFNGAISGYVALICLSVILFVYRLINILFLAKKKIFAIFATGAMWILDLVCILMAFFTSSQGPGTQWFNLEIMLILATLVMCILMVILLRELYKGTIRGRFETTEKV